MIGNSSYGSDKLLGENQIRIEKNLTLNHIIMQCKKHISPC